MNTRDTKDEEKNADRLSNLPDCVILHILSFYPTTKEALQTCILSKRWTNIWKGLPSLTLASSQFNTINGLALTNKFLSHVLSHRDSSTSLHYIRICREVIMDPCLIETIIEYAVSHNVQHLNFNFKCDIQSFPPCLFSSHTLTSLHLMVAHPTRYSHKILFPNSLHLPALTTLVLRSFSFSAGNDGHVEPFSALKKLKSLTIFEWEVVGAQNLCISSTTLVILVLSPCHIFAPPSTYFGIELSTPSLCVFYFRGIPHRKLCESKTSLPNIRQVNIDLISLWNSAETSLVLLEWLVELANTRSLTVNSTTLEVLSFVPDLLKTKPPSLCNLKQLEVKMAPGSSSIPDGIVNILRRKSPLAKLEHEPRAHESRSYKCWVLQKRRTVEGKKARGIPDADVLPRNYKSLSNNLTITVFSERNLSNN